MSDDIEITTAEALEAVKRVHRLREAFHVPYVKIEATTFNHGKLVRIKRGRQPWRILTEDEAMAQLRTWKQQLYALRKRKGAGSPITKL